MTEQPKQKQEKSLQKNNQVFQIPGHHAAQVSNDQSHAARSLPLLLCPLGVGPAQGSLDAGPHLRVQQCSQEDHRRAHPVPDREGVLEVPHGDDEAEELPEGHHQGDGQRRALSGQDEHATDAHVSEGRAVREHTRGGIRGGH